MDVGEEEEEEKIHGVAEKTNAKLEEKRGGRPLVALRRNLTVSRLLCVYSYFNIFPSRGE